MLERFALTTALPQRRIPHRYLLPAFEDFHIAEEIAKVARNATTNRTPPDEA